MVNRSNFPTSIDTFVEHYDITSADVVVVQRFQELKLKSLRTLVEENELSQLTTTLRNKIISPEDFNKFQDALVNMEVFIRDNVEGYILTKQNEFNTYLDNKTTEINKFSDTKKTEVTSFTDTKKAEIITLKDNFTTLVNTKSAELTTLVSNKSSELTTLVTNKSDALTKLASDKTNELTALVNTKSTEITNHTNAKTVEIQEKSNYFTNFVNIKEDEVRKLVREYDSNAHRYYQSWSSLENQTTFDIFTGGNFSNIPSDAKLDIDEKNIDLIINGTIVTPYVDFRIKPDGLYTKIELLGGAQLSAGTEVVAKWYKNVGKLYFTHASQHSAGGTDPIIVSEAMIEASLKPRIPKISPTAPMSPVVNQIWIDTN